VAHQRQHHHGRTVRKIASSRTEAAAMSCRAAAFAPAHRPIAIRLPGRTLAWNAERLEFAGDAAAQARVTKPYRRGWEPRWP
jgi:hypothetical protein